MQNRNGLLSIRKNEKKLSINLIEGRLKGKNKEEKI